MGAGTSCPAPGIELGGTQVACAGGGQVGASGCASVYAGPTEPELRCQSCSGPTAPILLGPALGEH